MLIQSCARTIGCGDNRAKEDNHERRREGSWFLALLQTTQRLEREVEKTKGRPPETSFLCCDCYREMTL
jgi:hypothetical protein